MDGMVRCGDSSLDVVKVKDKHRDSRRGYSEQVTSNWGEGLSHPDAYDVEACLLETAEK
jgi:hypothetical protein